MMPWVAMSFWPLYLQLLGFSDNVSGMIVSLFTLGTAFGCQLAGFLGVRVRFFYFLSFFVEVEVSRSSRRAPPSNKKNSKTHP